MMIFIQIRPFGSFVLLKRSIGKKKRPATEKRTVPMKSGGNSTRVLPTIKLVLKIKATIISIKCGTGSKFLVTSKTTPPLAMEWLD